MTPVEWMSATMLRTQCWFRKVCTEEVNIGGLIYRRRMEVMMRGDAPSSTLSHLQPESNTSISALSQQWTRVVLPHIKPTTGH